jgi:hypothetical protein
MPETGFTHWCKTADEAIQLLSTGEVEFISFDHDLGADENGTGYGVACCIEMHIAQNLIPMPQWAVHSANPVGRKNIERAMTKAEMFNQNNIENEEINDSE